MPKGMQSADADTRARVARAGGAGRAAAMTAEQRSESARTAVRAAHRPAALARRIVKAWPDLDPEERAEVLGILTASLPLRRR